MTLQLFALPQFVAHPPPAQSSEHSAPLPHVIVQLPPGHENSHFDPLSQRKSQPRSPAAAALATADPWRQVSAQVVPAEHAQARSPVQAASPAVLVELHASVASATATAATMTR